MMGSVTQDGPEKNLLAMLNRQMRNGDKEAREFIMDEDDSRFNEVLGSAGALGYRVALQKQQQQPLVQWEKFLPFRTLKVLLVENDDSTRHVVSALLRNCSYEVTAAANSLQAWNILEDLTNHIDLILAEVVMPCVSGIGLLCKIMSHKTCKNIPVIMMSSNDSMGSVFKCLSKGAVDFLVKPVRKNELKNLWQHVWRRCQSSSGSVNESDIQTQRSAKSKGSDDSGSDTSSNDGYGNGLIDLNARDGSDNGSETQSSGSVNESDIQTQRSAKSIGSDDSGSDTSSNDGYGNGIIDLNARDGSDNGSETQSSWAKHIAEEKDCDGSPSPSDLVADPTTLSNKIKSFCNEWVSMTSKWECQEKKETADDFMGKDLEIGLPTNPDTRRESYPTDDLKFSKASEDDVTGTAGSIDLPSLELSLKRPTATRHGINVLRFQGINHLHLHTIQPPPDSTNEKCVTLDVFRGQGEVESADSGSNCGSHEQKGSNAAFMDSGVDPDPSAVRAAALNKFWLKRKERNFEKKIRYQSRKRLAEQRPRVRGQFVPWAAEEHTWDKAGR